ncbi:TetR/AcrR family transcriptional regulator [Streptomyces sp. NPDC093223]|uniref:TetR/AcrR family transcriptional regulator n=1 Tax=Streptomyces sp. NPDC093223 TaxID=3366033 RepID=UPI00380D4DBB
MNDAVQASRQDAAAESQGPDGNRRGVRTRHAIDRAATDLFFRLGYHATSMRAIGDAAQVRSAAIYHWYPNKEALLIHLQNEFMRELTKAVESAADRHTHPVFRLAAAVREHVVFHGLHQQEAFVTDSEIRALAPGPRDALVARRDAYQQYFVNLISAGRDRGLLRPTDVHVATYAVLLQCTGVSAWFKASGRMTIAEVADHHVDLVLGSLHADRGLIGAAAAAVRPD